MKPLIAILCLLALPAVAEPPDKIHYGYSGGADSAAAWVAKEHGFFDLQNLDVDLTQTTNSALFPAALQSGSLDIAAPTAPLILQADAGGLDLVIISGGSILGADSASMAALARPGLGLHAAPDFTGRKVAVPGIGGFFDILFREWLRRGGVAPTSVITIELNQGGMADALRGGSVDAVVVSDPTTTRIQQLHAGIIVAAITAGLPENLPVIVYAARRDWADANSRAAHAFAQAIADATTYAQSHPEETRALIAHYLKINADLATLPALRADLSTADLALWLPILQAQGLIPTSLELAHTKW